MSTKGRWECSMKSEGSMAVSGVQLEPGWALHEWA